MTNKSGAGAATRKVLNAEEQHFVEKHMTIVFDKENNHLHIGFGGKACDEPGCPGGEQLIVSFQRCPTPMCPPPPHHKVSAG